MTSAATNSQLNGKQIEICSHPDKLICVHGYDQRVGHSSISEATEDKEDAIMMDLYTPTKPSEKSTTVVDTVKPEYLDECSGVANAQKETTVEVSDTTALELSAKPAVVRWFLAVRCGIGLHARLWSYAARGPQRNTLPLRR